MKALRILVVSLALVVTAAQTIAQVVPKHLRGTSDAERKGLHDANNIRTEFWNYGMVGNYPADPINVDLSIFHSMEVPKGSGVNYSDGTTPFILSKIRDLDGVESYIMETGYRERQASRSNGQQMRFEPRPGYFQADVLVNRALSPAVSNDPRTWPATWPDRDPSWDNSWNGYFGKRPAADQESFTVMDDDYYDAWKRYIPDPRDPSRRGLGMRVEVRGFQWSNPQSQNVIFWHYDITNESLTDYPKPDEDENIIFGIYMDSGVGGSAISCDGIAESDDDNAFWDRSYAGLNLVYTWDLRNHGVGLGTTCATSGYLGYAYLETPGKPYDNFDNDDDGIIDEARNSGPGQQVVGGSAIVAEASGRYDMAKFEAYYGKLEDRPAYKAGIWWTGDENMSWTAEYDDVGADGIPETGDTGEGDGMPTAGETNFDQTESDESDQIGLTGFKMNRIAAGRGNPSTEVDGIIFFTNPLRWPQRLYEKFTTPVVADRFDDKVAANYNIGFLFASGPFTLRAGTRERFSLALAFGGDLEELRRTVTVVQAIYNANYQFSTPPPTPTVKADAGDGYVQLSWDDIAENATNPIVGYNAFEGYRIYRSTDPDFLDPKVILNARGTNTLGNGKPLAQFDLIDGISGFSDLNVEGIAYYLGDETGLTHAWRDPTVTNGQLYYYAVCAYDFGPVLARGTTRFTYYPGENAITVSRTLRGGTILPQNVVMVRPNPKVPGYIPAAVSEATRMSGDGAGTVNVAMINPALVPDKHLFVLTFNSDPDSVHATSYTLKDSATGEIVILGGDIFDGSANGQVGAGVMPMVSTPQVPQINTQTGWAAGSQTNAVFSVQYNTTIMPMNYKRFGYPEDITIRFSNDIIDTSAASFPFRPTPVKFTVLGHTKVGGQDVTRELPFLFTDLNGDGTLSHVAGGNHEAIQILTGLDTIRMDRRITWNVQMTGDNASTRTPGLGDVFELKLDKPFAAGDVFTFTTTAEVVSSDRAKLDEAGRPYVVPNPYVGVASFEPNPFGVQGRGDRRMEFRNIAQNSTVRIYTVRGELVCTLHHDGSTSGYVTWDLRTKDNLDVAPGLYVYHVEKTGVNPHVGKFAIIK